MTNKEAIILLSEHIDTTNFKYGAELEEALFIVANAIRKQQEEKELIIDDLQTQSVIIYSKAKDICKSQKERVYYSGYTDGICKAIEIVKRGGKE